MIGVETNILVYSHRRDSIWFTQASAAILALIRGTAPWAIPWPCIHEFISVVTNPRVYPMASSLDQALAQVDEWLASPGLHLLGERDDHLTRLAALARTGQVRGPMIHDARIAAICLSHGVTELWTTDRDFSRFPALKTRNPLLS